MTRPVTNRIGYFDTLEDLKACTCRYADFLYFIRGLDAVGDGGHGWFRWNSTDQSAGNDGTIVESSIVAAAQGRFNRFHEGVVNALWFPGDDLSERLESAYSALPDDGGLIFLPPGAYTLGAGVAFDTLYKRVTLVGVPGSGTTITYTPTTGTALTFDTGNDGTYSLNVGHGLRDINLTGPGNSTSAKGLVFGGTNGATGFLAHACRISGFGTGVEMGSHTWIAQFRGGMIRDCGTLLLLPSGLTEAGENIRFDHVTFADSPSDHTDAVWIQGGGQEVVFRDCSFDQAQLRIGNGATSHAQVVVSGCHFENPNLGTNYDFIVQDDHDGNFLRLTDSYMLQAKTSGGPAQLMTLQGGKIHISGLGLFTPAGSPLTHLAVLDNAVNVECYGVNDLSGNITGDLFGGSTTGFVVNFAGANTASTSPRNFVIKAGDAVGGGMFDVGGLLRGTGLNTSGAVYPGDASVSPATFQGSAGIWAGDGVPFDAIGSNGDLYFRADITGTPVYQRRSGAWTLILPNAHAATHGAGGSDPVKLDDLATPDDNTDLNASASAHGLLPKLSGSAAELLDGSGAWSTPKLDDLGAPDDTTDLNASASAHGLLPKLSGSDADLLRGDGTYGAPPQGTYSPTLVAVANVDSAAVNGALMYMRLGDLVIVTGRIDVDPTAAGGTATAVGIPLPVSSDLADSSDAAGVGTISTQDCAKIAGDFSNDRAQMTFNAQGTGSETWNIMFMYQVL